MTDPIATLRTFVLARLARYESIGNERAALDELERRERIEARRDARRLVSHHLCQPGGHTVTISIPGTDDVVSGFGPDYWTAAGAP